MDLARAFEVAEKNYLPLLEYFFAGEWKDTFLPSHDISHHRRVWKYAKELLAFCYHMNPDYVAGSVSKTIIACYLHDCGMAADQGPDHGFHSRILAEKFLRLNNIPGYFFSDILPVIENHDKKDYYAEEDPYSPGSILAVADDLDAFGFAGIYRYSEIYMARGVPGEDLGDRILENATKRFNNFVRLFGSSPDLLVKHEHRFNILKNFFTLYNTEKSGDFTGCNNEHKNIVFNLANVLRERIPLPLFCRNRLDDFPGPVGTSFFLGLLDDIQED